MPTVTHRRAMIMGLAAGTLAAQVRHSWAQSVIPGSNSASIVVPFAAGGTTDVVARVVAQILSESTNLAFAIDHRTGAGGDVSAEFVAKAAPDGRTLLLGHVGIAVTNQYIHKYVPYDSVESFAPVALIGEVANVLVVHPALPCRSLREFVEYCAAQGPGKVSYGSTGIDSAGHLAMEYLQSVAGIKLSHVVYHSRSRMTKDLLAGRLLITMDNLPAYLRHIQSGALRALAVSSASRWFTAPDIPTVAEQGYRGFDATLWWYVAAPAGTRLELIRRLSAAIVSGIQSETMARKMREIGVQELPSCPEDLTLHIGVENAKWRKVIAAAKLTPQ
jgi:tripartite-type tricarboxylate transporter receptor subunit TctC